MRTRRNFYWYFLYLLESLKPFVSDRESNCEVRSFGMSIRLYWNFGEQLNEFWWYFILLHNLINIELLC